VQFIDEEAIFDSIEQKVKEWRKKFMLLGAKFEWFCLEVKHFCCYNALTNDESFICWDRTKKDVWVRQPPPFAIRSHPKHKPVRDAYQDFLPRACKDGITIVGVRTAESVQRLMYMAQIGQASKSHVTKRRQLFPIYDWKDNDVWLYIKEQGIDIPVSYLHLWQVGAKRPALRISQFFSMDTARSLVKLNEYDPSLMERITRREPNAYLAALYYDSEMFGRSTRNRKEIESGGDNRDYKAELIKVFANFDRHFDTKHKKLIGRRYRDFFLKAHLVVDDDGFKKIYEGLMSGDPKLRTHRALYQTIFGKYITQAKKDHQIPIKGGGEQVD
jgi:predicted phosphoadenosine phosphosulfate sulfurtransferase